MLHAPCTMHGAGGRGIPTTPCSTYASTAPSAAATSELNVVLLEPALGADPVDWRTKGAVTPVKHQGVSPPHLVSPPTPTIRLAAPEHSEHRTPCPAV